MKRRTLLRAGLYGCASAALSRGAAAASAGRYPEHAVRMILPFPPGGAIDQMARVASQMLGTQLRQPFAVESMPGAGGIIGTSFVVHAPADGYTLLAASASAITIAPFMRASLPYDPSTDLQPIVMLGDSPIAVVVRQESPFKTLQQLIDAAKASPGKLTFGSAGHGTAAHLGGELFKWRAGVDLLHVPYQGVSPAQVDLLGGRVDMMFVNYTVVHPQVQAGKLRVLAIAATERMAGQPDFPTAAELGVSGYVAGNWNGLMAPARTPRPIVDRLNGIVVEGFKDPQLLARMTDMGMVPVTGTPDDFAARIRQEVAQMKTLIPAAGIKPE
ncbi:tripartite tricarboxylate transporter substrate binding protein [Pigmentiphaga soli]|uniref:Tripartite tricarboxylate transporter substrate binding protein n=1 Tax=Pigmentiphaga soli TaxID=1007095 RepID=A0ABP8GTC0_9BURK